MPLLAGDLDDLVITCERIGLEGIVTHRRVLGLAQPLEWVAAWRRILS